MSSPPVVVRTPASLSAFGAAGSCLGLAVDGWSTAEVRTSTSGLSSGPETQEEALARRAAEAVLRQAGVDGQQVRVRLHSDASPASGIGSRESSIVAGLVAGNELAGTPMDPEDLLSLGVEQGGRVEGLAASLLGGLQMATAWGNQSAVAPAALPMGLTLVLFLLDGAATHRDIPAASGQQSGLDAWRVALLVNAMASSSLDELAVHKPMQPGSVYPHCAPKRLTCAAAMIGGALTAVSADDGQALVALTRGREMTVAYEMAEAARQSGLQGAIKIAKPSSRGAYVV